MDALGYHSKKADTEIGVNIIMWIIFFLICHDPDNSLNKLNRCLPVKPGLAGCSDIHLSKKLN